jgi:hypothetical protein
MPGVLGIAGARTAGLATGLVLLAGVALTQWSVAPSRAALGLDLKLTAVTHGELEVGPAGPAVLARGMRPGHEAVGAVKVRNQTSARLAIRPRLLEGPKALDGTLRFELTVGPAGRRVFSGPASALRSGGAPFVLASGERATIAVRAFVPDGGERATRGRAGEWRLAFATEVLR